MLILNNRGVRGQIPPMMKNLVLSLVLSVGLAGAGHAACYADYKAKRDGPLKLHYGVIELPQDACSSKAKAARVAAGRISAGGWTLLSVVSTFGSDGLAKRRDRAGDFYLRY